MLFSVVDDRSGVGYQEYRCVYGEEAEAALRFLFNAMAAKPEAELPFQGIPDAIYMDNGPVSRAKVFQSVMGSLGVRVLTHMPPSEGDRRTPARSKGKVERPFRTLKEAHETLYHFHEPADEAEANLWLRPYLVNYNNGRHRSEDHGRIEDWLKHLPSAGVRAMCAWERFCAFARAPERRTVPGPAPVFDQELHIEHDGRRFGPYQPSRGAIPLYRYRKYQKSKAEERIDRVVKLADQLGLPRAALSGGEAPFPSLPPRAAAMAVRTTPFPEAPADLTFKAPIAARLAIADLLSRPLGTLAADERAFIDALLSETLERDAVMGRVRERFRKGRGS